MPGSVRCSLNVTFHFWGLPLDTALDGAVAAGFSTIELLDVYGVELDDLEAALDRRGLRVDLFNLPMGDLSGGDRGIAGIPSRRDEFRTGVDAAVRIAERLGTRKVNVLSGSLVEDENETAQLECFQEQLAWSVERLAPVGVSVNIEVINRRETPGYLLSSIDHAREIIDALDRRIGLQLDIYHLQRTQGELIPTIADTASITGHYQIADAPARTEPGTGEIAYANVLQAIAATGYEGLVGCEYKPSSHDVDPFAWMDELGVVRA